MAAERYIAVPSLPVILTLAQRELVRFFRQRNRVVGALLQPILFWALFSAGLRGNDLGFTFFFPGTIAMILLFTAIFTTISIVEDRREGFLQSVLVSPAPRWARWCVAALSSAPSSATRACSEIHVMSAIRPAKSP